MNLFDDLLYPFIEFILTFGTTVYDVLFVTEISIDDLGFFGTLIDYSTSLLPSLNEFLTTPATPFVMFTSIFVTYVGVLLLVKIISALLPD